MPLYDAPLEPHSLAMLQTINTFERFTIDAAVNGDYQSALRALTLNPLVKTGKVLEAALDETIRENIKYMPQFQAYYEANLK